MKKGKIIGLGRTAEIHAWDNNQVLKLFHHGWPLSAIEWEEKVARTVSDAGLSVPAVYGVVEVGKRHGIIYERVDGPSMLTEIISKPEKLEHFANLFAKLHTQMHAIQIRRLPSQRQQLEKKIRNAMPLSEERRKAALKALDKLPDNNVVCHGDFHPDNILMSTHGPVIIDWNDATQGNPHADIARTLLLLQQGEPQEPSNTDKEQMAFMRSLFIDIYLESYAKIRPFSFEGIDLWRLPIAAARLSEGIQGEESRLVSIVEALLNQAK